MKKIYLVVALMAILLKDSVTMSDETRIEYVNNWLDSNKNDELKMKLFNELYIKETKNNSLPDTDVKYIVIRALKLGEKYNV